MSGLPNYGRINCNICHKNKAVMFNKTLTCSSDDKWRITSNPLSWGGSTPKIVVLGFSKGPAAIKQLNDPRVTHEDIPYATKRGYVARILHRLGLLKDGQQRTLEQEIIRRNGDFHFASLIRCTVEQFKKDKDGHYGWGSSGGSMLEGFGAHEFGREVVTNCIKAHLGDLPPTVKLVLLFGYGSQFVDDDGSKKYKYVEAVKRSFEQVFGPMTTLNPVSYFNEQVTFVHVEHFSEPSYATKWLAEEINSRTPLREMSHAGVQFALGR